MTQTTLFTSINYNRPVSYSEKALSILSSYYSLGKKVVVVKEDDRIHTETQQKHWYVTAFKIASYVLLLPLTLLGLGVYLSLYYQNRHTFIVNTSPSLIPIINNKIQNTSSQDQATFNNNEAISKTDETDPTIFTSLPSHSLAPVINETKNTSPQDQATFNNNEAVPKTDETGLKDIEIVSTKESFLNFTEELEGEIFKYYEEHEKTFDRHSIHGRMHVARAVIFAEVMIRYFQRKGESIDLDYARRTIALHDAGRKGNGPDMWEKESAHLLCQHLKSKGMPEQEAFTKSRIIIKDSKHEISLESIIFQSADCLDIMRPCTGHKGINGFKPQFLSFLKDSVEGTDDFKFRQDLIKEAWEFIKMTEEKKYTDFKENAGFMQRLLEILKNNSKQFIILSSIL